MAATTNVTARLPVALMDAARQAHPELAQLPQSQLLRAVLRMAAGVPAREAASASRRTNYRLPAGPGPDCMAS